MKKRRPKYRLTIFRGVNLDYYWHIEAANGRVVCDGGEGYKRKIDIRKVIDKLIVAEQIEVRDMTL